MSDKEKGLPLLRKTPVDFLSREEARQALKPDVALDASEGARPLRSEPNSENMLLAQHLSHASHGSHRTPGSHGRHGSRGSHGSHGTHGAHGNPGSPGRRPLHRPPRS